jgi:hypothetical protein
LGHQNLENSTWVGPDESAFELPYEAVGKLAAKVDDLRAKIEQFERGIRMDVQKTVEMSSGNMFSCNEVAVSDVTKDDSNKTDGCRGERIQIEHLFCIGWDA